jgi:ankyrin repeat protein
MKKFCVLLVTALCAVSVAEAVTSEDFARAIRANDLSALRKLAGTPAAANLENNLHSTPLHDAAIYGSADAVRILLEAGADPNARNQQQATPLIYAAWNFAKTRLLIDKGAQVNVAAKNGVTPLMVAASALGNSNSVRYLLEHGADAKATDMLGGDALIRAGWMSDPQAVELLLAKGANARNADRAGFTALQMAPDFADCERISLLLKAGADVNSFNMFAGQVKNGPIALVHLTPLMLAAPYGDAESIGTLLKAGARVNETDIRKMTPLMLAIATDQAKPATVRQLIAAGADVNAKDQSGESVLDWARKFRNPGILSILESAGAQGRHVAPAPRPADNSQAGSAAEAFARTLSLLAKTGPRFFKEGGGCSGCHHQPMEARAFAAASAAHVKADESIRQPFRDSVLAERPVYLTGLPFLQALPGDVDRVLMPLMTLADLSEPGNDFTDAALHYLAARQDTSGAWVSLGIARPPIEESTISRTAMAVRALRIYGWPARQAEFDERIERARAWLENSKPVTTYEEADRIMGLRAAGVAARDLRAAAAALLSKQRADGGWAQTAYLDSDAYATGLILHTLYVSGLTTPDAPAYRRGIAFLLRTQFPDGSWYVRSRAPKFQPYFQSGFPFDHDQWISSAGTAWAAMALAPAAAFASAPSADKQSGSF